MSALRAMQSPVVPEKAPAGRRSHNFLYNRGGSADVYVHRNSFSDFIPFDPDAEVLRSRRNLPHWEQPGCTYFVTFRLGDSIPASKLNIRKAERDLWLQHHPGPSSSWSPAVWQEYQERFLSRIERWSDAGWGSCVLRDPDVRKIVGNAFAFFDRERYEMDHFVIMPNHAHLLFRLFGDWRLGQVLHTWKSFTSHRINDFLGRKGTNLWMDERFDHIVRSEAQLGHYNRYITDNPMKAALREGEYTLWER